MLLLPVSALFDYFHFIDEVTDVTCTINLEPDECKQYKVMQKINVWNTHTEISVSVKSLHQSMTTSGLLFWSFTFVRLHKIFMPIIKKSNRSQHSSSVGFPFTASFLRRNLRQARIMDCTGATEAGNPTPNDSLMYRKHNKARKNKGGPFAAFHTLTYRKGEHWTLNTNSQHSTLRPKQSDNMRSRTTALDEL